MNRRGKRLTLGVVAAGLAVVLGLTIAHWGTVRDHVEAWHFQLTRETMTVEPGRRKSTEMALPGDRPLTAGEAPFQSDDFLRDIAYDNIRNLATALHCPLICDAEKGWEWEVLWLPNTLSPSGESIDDLEYAMRTLSLNGWRVLEQRFPRRAYLVIRGDHPQGRVARHH